MLESAQPGTGNRNGSAGVSAAALLAHVVGWFGCSYMAKMQMALFPLLAMISVAIFEAKGPPMAQVEALNDSHITSVPDLVEAWT